jgi:hypothetical protein
MVKKKHAQITKERIEKLQEKGLSFTAIAGHYGVTPDTIKARLAGGWGNFRKEQIRRKRKKEATSQPAEPTPTVIKKDTCGHAVVVRNGEEELFSIDESGIKLCRPDKIDGKTREKIVQDLQDLARVVDATE